MPVHISSEIGRLRGVLVHTPGRELLAVTPSTREDYLYDDIIDADAAQREHRRGVGRRQFVARCATGDWDGIIMSRSAFERIPMSAQAQQAYLDRELNELRAWIAEARKGEGLSVKRLEATLLRAEERRRGKLDRARDPGVQVGATGVDYLGV